MDKKLYALGEIVVFYDLVECEFLLGTVMGVHCGNLTYEIKTNDRTYKTVPSNLIKGKRSLNRVFDECMTMYSSEGYDFIKAWFQGVV
jgi:hypothetical protein